VWLLSASGDSLVKSCRLCIIVCLIDSRQGVSFSYSYGPLEVRGLYRTCGLANLEGLSEVFPVLSYSSYNSFTISGLMLHNLGKQLIDCHSTYIHQHMYRM
jgi:hypothetical protein